MSKATWRAVAREVAIFAFFLAAAIAYTWPMIRNLDTAVSDLGDPLLNTWILDWSLHSLKNDPLHLYDAPIFTRSTYPHAFSENLVGIALVVLPFSFGDLSPIEIYNVAVLIGFALNGYGACLLARTTKASLPLGLILGISFAFAPFLLDHLPQLQIVSAGWLPIMVAALIHFFRHPGWSRSMLFAGALAMAGLTNVHWLLFGGFSVAALAALVLAVDASFRTRRTVVPLLGGFIAAGLILLPFLIPYLVVSRKYGMVRHYDEVAAGSAVLLDYFRTTGRTLVYGQLGLEPVAERNLFLGFLPLALAAVAWFMTPARDGATASGAAVTNPSRKLLRTLDVASVLLAILVVLTAAAGSKGLRLEGGPPLIRHAGGPLGFFVVVVLVRLWLQLPDVWSGGRQRGLGRLVGSSRFWPETWIGFLVTGIGVVGSLGMNSFLHPFLYAVVEPFRATRVPARWAVITGVGLVILAAQGGQLLLDRTRGVRRAALATLMGMSAIADTACRINWTHVVVDPVPVYEWLATKPVRGPVFELPMFGEGIPYRYLLALAGHRIPLVNGTSGFAPPFHRELEHYYYNQQFHDVFLALVAAQGTQLIVVHADQLGGRESSVVRWLRRSMAYGDLAFVRRFDHENRGDYVFAIRKNLPDWERLRERRRDAAGFTEEENLARFLDRQIVYSDRPVVHIDQPPPPWAERHRRLEISGWAVARPGIRSVEVLLHGRRLRYVADRVPRKTHPWYPNDPVPGFRVVIPKRPKGVPKEIDLSLRVTDNEGRVVHTQQQFIRWH